MPRDSTSLSTSSLRASASRLITSMMRLISSTCCEPPSAADTTSGELHHDGKLRCSLPSPPGTVAARPPWHQAIIQSSSERQATETATTKTTLEAKGVSLESTLSGMKFLCSCRSTCSFVWGHDGSGRKQVNESRESRLLGS